MTADEWIYEMSGIIFKRPYRFLKELKETKRLLGAFFIAIQIMFKPLNQYMGF